MRRAILLPLVATLAACQQAQGGATATAEGPVGGPPAAVAAARRAPLALDLSRAVEQVRRAVRRDGDWLRARGEHHALSVDAAGRAQVTALGAARAALTVETGAVTRGSRSLLSAPAARADGATVVVARGVVEERLENGAAGVEQRWHLGARPAGAGDLVVSVRVDGLPYAGATAKGLHFGEPAGGALVRYGAATLVDAAGRRTPLATAYAAGTIRITVPGSTVDAAAYPAVVDPVISVEHAVDAPPGGFPASGNQVQPSIACLSGIPACLVAWRDLVPQWYGAGAQVRAALVQGSGAALADPSGIDVDLASGGSDCGAPLVLATGLGGSAEFAVVFTSTDPIGAGTFRRRLKVARVSAAGAVLGAPVTLSQDAQGDVFQFQAAVGDGGKLAVVWSDIQELRFTVLQGGTTAVATRVPVVKPAVPTQTWWGNPAVVWTGSAWLLAWRSTASNTPVMQAISAAFLDTGGSVIGSALSGAIIPGGSQGGVPDFLSQPVLASDGAGTALVLTASKNGNEPWPGQLLALRLTQGQMDSTSWPIVTPAFDGSAAGASAWWDGTQFQLLIQHQATGGQGLSRQAVPAAPLTTVPGSLPSGLPALAGVTSTGRAIDGVRGALGGAGQAFVAWEDRAGLTSEVRAAAFAPPADPLAAGTLLTLGGADEDEPSAAFAGGVWLVAWSDQRTVSTGTSVDVWAVRLAQGDGTSLDPAGLHLTTATGAQVAPQVAGGNGSFLVAWRDERGTASAGDIYATSVTAGGIIGATTGTPVVTSVRSEQPVAAAFDGSDFHVLFVEEDASPPSSPVLRDVRIGPGLVVSSPQDVAPSSDPNRHLQGNLACRGGGCLAVWSEELGGDVWARNVTTLAPAQSVASGLALPPTALVSASSGAASPFLVSWTAWDGGAGANTLWSRLVGLDGTGAAPPFQVAAASAGVPGRPAASFDGIDHVLAWSPDAGGLAAAWVQPTGSLRAVPATLVPAALDGPRGPVALAGDGEGRTLVAYTVFDQGLGVRARRVRIRLASYSKLLGDPCLAGTECASGFCAEGVCCDGACGGGTDPCRTCAARGGFGAVGHCTVTAGATCDDGQACTRTDVCSPAGACGGTGYTCTATQCQASISCDGAGGCVPVNRPNTTPCDDGNPCTHGDACAGGACVGSAITCAPTQCQLSSTCNGTATCAVANKPDSSACNDGNGCTVNDTCQSGVCVAGSPRVCPSLADPCKGAGTCEQATGACVYVAAPDGTDCAGGTCQGGECRGHAAAVLGMSCATGPGGWGALLLALLALGTRRARRSP